MTESSEGGLLRSIFPAQGPSEIDSVFDAISLLVIVIVGCAALAMAGAYLFVRFPRVIKTLAVLLAGILIINGLIVLFR